jgi:hypothetical protein
MTDRTAELLRLTDETLESGRRVLAKSRALLARLGIEYPETLDTLAERAVGHRLPASLAGLFDTDEGASRRENYVPSWAKPLDS